MLGFVEVAVGNVGVMLQARDWKQIVTVRGLPHVDQVGEFSPVIP
jgi:hypothetical protein